MARFSDVLTIVNGKNQSKVENPNGKYPIYGSGGIMGYADDYICEAQTVIIGRKGSINKPIFVETPFWNVDTAFGLSANKDILLPKYLYYFCEHFDFEKLNTTVTIPSLTKANLLNIEMALPTIEQQREIVFQLDNVESIISLRKQQLSKLDELVKSRFIEMFGDESKYQSTPLNESVEEMFIGPFGSSLKNECFVSKENGYCMVYEQKHAIRKTMDVDTRYVDEKKYTELQRFTIQAGDIIVSCRGTIGETFVVPNGAPMGIMHPSIMKIRLKESAYNKVFFNHLLIKVLKQHEAEANGSGIKMAITATELGKELFIVPPMDLQQQFAAFVEQVDKSKFKIQQSIDKLETLKKSLMQQYFG